jgi:hypothetical protein
MKFVNQFFKFFKDKSQRFNATNITLRRYFYAQVLGELSGAAFQAYLQMIEEASRKGLDSEGVARAEQVWKHFANSIPQRAMEIAIAAEKLEESNGENNSESASISDLYLYLLLTKYINA